MTKEINYKGQSIIVSDNGTIEWNNSIRNHYMNADGYPCVTIKTDKGWRQISIHRLIATAFIPNPNNLPQVDHIDFDRTNYSISNLQWISTKDNVRRSVINRPDLTGVNNPNYGNRKLSKFYKANPEIAKEKQGRVGEKNGRYKSGKYIKCNDHLERE